MEVLVRQFVPVSFALRQNSALQLLLSNCSPTSGPQTILRTLLSGILKLIRSTNCDNNPEFRTRSSIEASDGPGASGGALAEWRIEYVMCGLPTSKRRCGRYEMP